MSTRERRIPVFADGRNKYYVSLPVEVDETGEYWLTPDQVWKLDRLRLHLSHSIRAGSAVRRTRKLLIRMSMPTLPTMHDERAWNPPLPTRHAYACA